MIRRAKISDVEQINNIGILINTNFDKLFKMANIISDDISFVYVYEEDDIIKGFLQGTVLYENADIINLAVLKKYQNKKIASMLIDYMLSDFSQEIKVVTLDVAKNNFTALALYKKFSFEQVRIRPNYYGPNVDGIVMARKVIL